MIPFNNFKIGRTITALLIFLHTATSALSQRMYDSSGRQIGRVDGITMLRDTKLVELMDSTFTTDLADNSDALMETASTTHLGVRLVALMVNAFTAPQALKWAELKARGFMTHQVVKSAELMDCEECKSSFTFISSCKPNMILVLSS